MKKLSGNDFALLHRASGMQFSGGTMPYSYGDYRRLEKLRRMGLLRFWRRRSRQWRWCCYDITARGQSEISI